MALFFDAAWFDARLREREQTRADVAQALGVSPDEVSEIWKDQRELTPQDVATLAKLLKEETPEIVLRAGIATPAASTGNPLDDVATRLTRIERTLAELKALILDMRAGKKDE